MTGESPEPGRAVVVMVGGDRLVVAASAASVVGTLSQARREEFCSFEGPRGTVHVNPTQVAHIEEATAPDHKEG